MTTHKGVITRIDGKKCLIHEQNSQQTLRAYIPYKIKGTDPNTTKPVCVGDIVHFTWDKSKKEAILKQVEPRETKLSRRAIGPKKKEQIVASNVEQLLIVTSLGRPAFHPGIIDRFLVAAHQGGLEPLICINKTDLWQEEENQELVAHVQEEYQQLGYSLLLTSTVKPEGISELKSKLRNKITVVGGHSGVGKSSLLLSIDPHLNLVTKTVGKKSRRGQHATTSVQLLPITGGGYVVDTPGIRELSLWETEVDELWSYFPEIAQRQDDCKYRGCSHIHEPGCAVKQAVEEGEIAGFRYESYVRIIESILYPTVASRPPYRDAEGYTEEE